MLIQGDVARIPLPDESVDLIFTDPPYGKDYLHIYKYVADEAARLLKPKKFVAVMCEGIGLNKIFRYFDDAELEFLWLYQLGMGKRKSCLIWINGNQTSPINTRTKHILVYSKGNVIPPVPTVGLYWAGGIDKRWHHWGQDIDSHRYYIECFSRPGDLILDPCAGGGTTMAACKLLDRKWILSDIDEKAIRVCVERNKLNYCDLPLFSKQES